MPTQAGQGLLAGRHKIIIGQAWSMEQETTESHPDIRGEGSGRFQNAWVAGGEAGE